MGRRKRKFIDEKSDKVLRFTVVARSQQDPLVADEAAPQSVLLLADEEKRKEEQRKYGVYFDDNYDYLRHLKGVREAVNWNDADLEVYTIKGKYPKASEDKNQYEGLRLPSSVFESYVEEPIGLLNRAAPVTGPRPELDPDIVAALDDDNPDICGPEDPGGLPDNFIMLLNSEEIVSDLEEDDEDVNSEDNEKGCSYSAFDMGQLLYRKQYYSNSDDEVEDGSHCEFTFKNEETKSHFTSYSLSSSVLHRNDKLTQLDDQFEEKFLKEYGDDQLGALDEEEIEGFIGEDSEQFLQAINQCKELPKENESNCDKQWITKWVLNMQKFQHKEDIEEVEINESTKDDHWDCETILSTYSNIYNHPKKIVESSSSKKIAVDCKSGIPLEHFSKGLTKKSIALHNQQFNATEGDDDEDLDAETLITTISAISIRPPGETTEERRNRKKALKELRRERRIERKLNKSLFKEEKLQQLMNMRNSLINKKLVM